MAAAIIAKDTDFKNELERLSSSFGIGVISVDVEDLDATSIVFPARSKDFVDWETVNKLTTLNSDFRDFLKRIKIDITSREIRRELYDPALSKEELVNSLAIAQVGPRRITL